MSCESSLRSCSRNKVGGHDVALGIAAPGHGGIFSWLNALANSKRHLPVPRLERSDSVAAGETGAELGYSGFYGREDRQVHYAVRVAFISFTILLGTGYQRRFVSITFRSST